MKNTTVAGLLRSVLVLWAGAVLTAAACFVPGFMRHVCSRPSGAGGLVRLGRGLWVAVGGRDVMRLWIFMAGRWHRRPGTGVVHRNATRFRRVWQLSAGCFGMCAGLAAFMGLTRILPPFLVLTVAGLLLATATAGLASFAFSGLCQSAALLREESEMTV